MTLQYKFSCNKSGQCSVSGFLCQAPFIPLNPLLTAQLRAEVASKGYLCVQGRDLSSPEMLPVSKLLPSLPSGPPPEASDSSDLEARSTTGSAAGSVQVSPRLALLEQVLKGTSPLLRLKFLYSSLPLGKIMQGRELSVSFY